MGTEDLDGKNGDVDVLQKHRGKPNKRSVEGRENATMRDVLNGGDEEGLGESGGTYTALNSAMEEALRGGCLSCDLYGSNAYDAGPPQGKNRVAATSNPEQNSGKEYAAHADATSNVASQPSARKSLPEKRIRPSAVAPLVVDTAAYDRSESAEEMVQAPRSPIASKRASNPDLSAHNRSSDPGNGNPRGLLGKFAEQMEKVALHGVTLEFNTPATFAGLMTVVAATFQITFYNMVLVESASHLGIGLSAIHFSSQIAGGYRASHRDAHDHLNLRSLDRASLAGFILVIANLVLLLATVVSLLMPRVSGWVFERRNTFVVLSLVGFVAVLIPGYWVVHSFFTAAHTLRLSLALSVVIAIVLRSCKMWGSRWVTPNLVGVPVAIVAGVAMSDHYPATDVVATVFGSLALTGLGTPVWALLMYPRPIKPGIQRGSSDAGQFMPNSWVDAAMLRCRKAWAFVKKKVRRNALFLAATCIFVGWACILGAWATVTVQMVLVGTIKLDTSILFVFALLTFSVLRWGSYLGVSAREEVIRNLVPPEVATALIAKTARGHHNYSAGAFGVAKRGAGQTARRSIALEDGAFRKTVAARVRNMNEARTPTHSADGNDMFSMRRGAGAAAAPARLGRKSVSSSPPIGQSGNPSGATGVSRKSRLSVTNGLMGSGPDRPAAMTQSHNENANRPKDVLMSSLYSGVNAPPNFLGDNRNSAPGELLSGQQGAAFVRKSTKGNLSTNLAAIQEEHGASSLASQDKNGAAAAAPRSGSLELGTKAPPKPAPRPPLPDGASRNQRGVNDGTSPAGTGTPQGGNSVSWRLSGTGLSGEGLSAGGQRDELGRRRSLDGLSMRDEEPMPEALDKVPGSMGAVVRTASNLNINPEAVEATALMSRFEEIKRKRHLSRFQGSFSVVHRQSLDGKSDCRQSMDGPAGRRQSMDGPAGRRQSMDSYARRRQSGQGRRASADHERRPLPSLFPATSGGMETSPSAPVLQQVISTEGGSKGAANSRPGESRASGEGASGGSRGVRTDMKALLRGASQRRLARSRTRQSDGANSEPHEMVADSSLRVGTASHVVPESVQQEIRLRKSAEKEWRKQPGDRRASGASLGMEPIQEGQASEMDSEVDTDRERGRRQRKKDLLRSSKVGAGEHGSGRTNDELLSAPSSGVGGFMNALRGLGRKKEKSAPIDETKSRASRASARAAEPEPVPAPSVFPMSDVMEGSAEHGARQLVYYKEHPEVTMVFSDLVGYTALSSTKHPADILVMLHEFFEQLDEVVEMEGAYKYETVGDAYVVAVNFSSPDPDHALTALRIAMSIAQLADSIVVPGGEGMRLQARVGVHTGPVAAGVLGRLRNMLTLVGDTLNTASRMESNSEPGCVQLSDAAWQLLPPETQEIFTHRVIDVKGKGPMTTHIIDAVNANVDAEILLPPL